MEIPKDYQDMGWQPKAEDLKPCYEANHCLQFITCGDRLQPSETLRVCHDCKTVYHFDSSD